MSSCICSWDKFDVEDVNAAKFGVDIRVAVAAADDSGIDVTLGGVVGGDIRLLSSMPLLLVMVLLVTLSHWRSRPGMVRSVAIIMELLL